MANPLSRPLNPESGVNRQGKMSAADVRFSAARQLGLAEALGVERGEVVVLVGAGGKTTTMFRLAAELAAAGGGVLVTTTTRILPPQPGEASATILGDDLQTLLSAARSAMGGHAVVAVARGLGSDGKLLGLDPAWVGELRAVEGVSNVLVEGDGSAGRSFKAPAAYEPVIPGSAGLVVPVVGLSAVGQPLAAPCVHRPERVAALTGAAVGEPVTPEMVAAVLMHPDGATRGAPAGARVVVLLNQADDEARLRTGRQVAHELLRLGARRVVIAAARNEHPVCEVAVPGATECRLAATPASSTDRPPPVAAIVLAAGEARRMGLPKLGLRLGGKSLLRRAVEAALGSQVDEVVVVLGCGAAELAQDLPQDARLRLVHNPSPAAGQSTSLKAGLAAISPMVGAAVFLLGDQPLVASEAVDALLDAFRSRGAQLALPLYRGVPGHPVLFARSLFPELLRVQGDQGGREVLARHRAEAVTVALDREAPEDVDTPAQYRQLAARFRERGEPHNGEDADVRLRE